MSINPDALLPGKHYIYRPENTGTGTEFCFVGTRNALGKLRYTFRDSNNMTEFLLLKKDLNDIHEIQVDPSSGTKYDDGKLRWGLLPFEAVQELVKVLTYGAKKYAPNNWIHVPDATNRYTDALFRHITAWKMGEAYDPETKLHHLAHAGCCLLFLLWFEVTKNKNTGK